MMTDLVLDAHKEAVGVGHVSRVKNRLHELLARLDGRWAKALLTLYHCIVFCLSNCCPRRYLSRWGSLEHR